MSREVISAVSLEDEESDDSDVESDLYRDFGKQIRERIIGQEEAVSLALRTILRKKNGWFAADKPLLFLFLGPSGTGKTELVKSIAKCWSDSASDFIRFDMSEFQELDSVSKLIGAPPCCTTSDKGGMLTNALKKSKNPVVLFDQVEQADVGVLTTFLQLFDEGRITDTRGEIMECKNALFIMTSNLGDADIIEFATKYLQNNNQTDANHRKAANLLRQLKDAVLRPKLKAHFNCPALLGRINEIACFMPFTGDELRQLANIQLKFWKTEAMNKHSVKITWDEEVIDVICGAYNIQYGARSITHEVERKIVSLLSELHHLLIAHKQVHIGVRRECESSLYFEINSVRICGLDH